jgi:hypothetical protein
MIIRLKVIAKEYRFAFVFFLAYIILTLSITEFRNQSHLYALSALVLIISTSSFKRMGVHI